MSLALLHVFLIDFEDTFHVRVVLKLLKCAKGLDLTVFEDNDPITQVQKVYGVGHEDSGFLLKHTLKDFLENLLPHIGIQGGNRVVHHDNVGVGIHGSRQTYSSLLASGEIDTLFPDFCHVTGWQDIEISLKLARFDGFCVPFRIKFLVKDNVVLDRFVLDPRCLLDVRERTSNLDRFVVYLEIPAEKVCLQLIELLLCALMIEPAEVIDLTLRQVDEVANDALEQA